MTSTTSISGFVQVMSSPSSVGVAGPGRPRRVAVWVRSPSPALVWADGASYKAADVPIAGETRAVARNTLRHLALCSSRSIAAGVGRGARGGASAPTLGEMPHLSGMLSAVGSRLSALPFLALTLAPALALRPGG